METKKLFSKFTEELLVDVLKKIANQDLSLATAQNLIVSELSSKGISENELTAATEGISEIKMSDYMSFTSALILLLFKNANNMKLIAEAGCKLINTEAYHHSAEMVYNYVTSPDLPKELAAKTGQPYNVAKSAAEQYIRDLKTNPNNDLWKQIDPLKNTVPAFLRGNKAKAVYEYCDPLDFDYSLTAETETSGSCKDFEVPNIAKLVEEFSDEPKSPELDGIIELVCGLLPAFYIKSSSLTYMHSDPKKASDAYDRAFSARKSTTPAVRKYTKDVYPGKFRTPEDVALAAEEARRAQAKKQAEAKAAEQKKAEQEAVKQAEAKAAEAKKAEKNAIKAEKKNARLQKFKVFRFVVTAISALYALLVLFDIADFGQGFVWVILTLFHATHMYQYYKYDKNKTKLTSIFYYVVGGVYCLVTAVAFMVLFSNI